MISIDLDPYRYDTLGRFHDSIAFICAIQGPFGSGKSTGAITKLWYNACEQPAAKNNIRYRRTAIIRNTYSQLQSTTIKTFSEWIPEEHFPVIGQAPITCLVEQALHDGTKVKWEVWFLALDKPADLAKIKSLDISDCWINEAVEVPIEMTLALTGRVGRYPPPKRGGCPNPQLLIDTNPGDEDDELYKLLEGQDDDLVKKIEESMSKYSKKRPLIEFFEQPGGLIRKEKTSTSIEEYLPNPLAENIDNLNGGYGYYYQQIVGKTRTSIDKFILGKKGAKEDGKPIYGNEYDDDRHYSRTRIEPVRGKLIIVGMDGGLTPAASFQQIDDNGRLVLLDELVAFDMAVQEFCEEALVPHIGDYYAGHQILVVFDFSNKRAETDAITPIKVIAKNGLKVKPAYTNNPALRQNDVRYFLLKRDGFIISSQCKYTRKAFQTGYRYKRLQVSGSRFSRSPDKNHFSHLSDAVQYGCGFFAQLARKPKNDLIVKPMAYRFA
jgi:hypothetical protein